MDRRTTLRVHCLESNEPGWLELPRRGVCAQRLESTIVLDTLVSWSRVRPSNAIDNQQRQEITQIDTSIHG